jgi:putative transposase
MFRIVRQLDPRTFIAEDLRFRQEQTFSESEILAHYASGRLRFASHDVQPAEPATDENRLVTVSDHWEQASQRWRAIEPLTHLERPPTAEEFLRRATEISDEGERVSARTLRRWFSRWRRCGAERGALTPRRSRQGARGKSRRHGWLKRFPQLAEMVDRALEEVYLTTARRPLSAVKLRVLEDLERYNARTTSFAALPVPKPGTLARTIARRAAQLDPYEVDRARWGRRLADQRHRSTSRQQLATRILERVEIDHSPLKIVVGSEAGPLGQPWLTVLIDYYSRMIVGFCIGFEPPSYGVIMEALRQAILPKAYVPERYPKIKNDWPCFGIPEKLVCDRGSDLTSKDLEQAAFQLGMELDFMPPRTPHLKGTVESFFDVLNDQLFSTLPGRTFRSWERRADYSADDGPLLPYDALVEIIHRHLIDVYAQEKHPTAAKSRLEVWQESAAEFPPALPTSPDDLVLLLSKSTERSLSVRGIELSGMFYLSDETAALRAELAAHNLSTDKLTVRYNPWDLGAVWILNPVSKSFIKAAAVDASLAGMTAYQWRVLRRAVRERFDSPDHVLSLASARNAIRDVVERSVTKRSRRRRVRAARHSGAFQGIPEQIVDGTESNDTTEQDETEPAIVSPVSSEPVIPESTPPTAPALIDVDEWGVAF